jgi:membrane-associated phospholipid phosphatase
MKFQSRLELSATLSRSSPALIFLFAFLNAVLNPSYQSFYLIIILILLSPLNWILKHLIAKPLYNLLNKKSLPILGSGERPIGAVGCSLVLDNVKSTTFGMPSGHSQIIWTLGTYLLCKVISNWHNKITNADKNKLSTTFTVLGYLWIICICIIILAVMIYVSYSRVYIEGCHTIQQITVGGIIGATCGFLTYYFEQDTVNILKQII